MTDLAMKRLHVQEPWFSEIFAGRKDVEDKPEDLFAYSFSDDFCPAGSCNFSRIYTEDVLRMDNMFRSAISGSEYFEISIQMAKAALRRKKLYERRQKLQREWSRTFWSDGRLAGFFCENPGLRKFIGTKLLLFSNFSDYEDK